MATRRTQRSGRSYPRDRAPVPEQLEERVLGDLLGPGSVADDVVDGACDAGELPGEHVLEGGRGSAAAGARRRLGTGQLVHAHHLHRWTGTSVLPLPLRSANFLRAAVGGGRNNGGASGGYAQEQRGGRVSGMCGMGQVWRHMRTDRSIVNSKLDRGTVRRVLAFARPAPPA